MDNRKVGNGVILRVFKPSDKAYAKDNSLKIYSGFMNYGDNHELGRAASALGNPPPKYDQIAPNNEMIDRDGNELAIGKSQTSSPSLAVKDAAEGGNYDFKSRNDKNSFNVYSVEDGVVTGETSYTKNEMGEYEKSSTTLYSYEIGETKTAFSKDANGRSFVETTTLINVTQTTENLKNNTSTITNYQHTIRNRQYLRD